MKRRLLDALAAEGDELCKAAAAIGGTIAFAPRVALERDGVEGAARRSLRSATGYCRLIEASDGWIAANLAREEDRQTVPAWIGPSDIHTGSSVDGWRALTLAAAKRTAKEIVAAGVELHLPVALVGETAPRPPRPMRTARGVTRSGRPTAIDMSALWAGPYCGGLLAEAGVAVTRIESTTRPDPTSRVSPLLDQRLNGRKSPVRMSPADPKLKALIADADILITSARPHSLARLGLGEDALFALNPHLIWIAVTAHGWSGDAGMRVGFGDDCAAAGGLVKWRDGRPQFIGDALADPLTGLAAATEALKMLARRDAGLVDVALARVAARMAERLELRPSQQQQPQ